MEFFALDDDVIRLEQALAQACGAARLNALLALAWQKRQRDTQAALALADEAQALLDLHACKSPPTNPPTSIPAAQARLMLIRAEAQWLDLELAAATNLAQAAQAAFDALGDAIGCADACWLLSLLAHAQGDSAARLAQLVAMEQAAKADPVRVGVAQAQQAQAAAFRDVAAAKQHWGAHFAAGSAGLHPAVACHVEFFLAACANIASDFASAIGHNIATFNLALASGQIRTAVFAATNAGDAFNSLNEYNAALEWMQRGLDLARSTLWPAVLGAALAQTALTLRHLQRPDAARAMLREALVLLAPQAASRTCVITLSYLGDAELDCKDPAAALEAFGSMIERADALGQPQLQSLARRGQSQALLQLGQPQPALAAAEAALSMAKGGHEPQIAALQVLADIHTAHRLPAPPDMKAPNAALHYLQRALALAETMEGFIIPPDLLEALANASERAGLPGQAYRYARQAIQARKKTHSREAANRACALQLSWQSHSARAQAAHQQQLAQLAALGQELAASQNVEQIGVLLHGYASRLLAVARFALWLPQPNGPNLKLAYYNDGGQPLPLMPPLPPLPALPLTLADAASLPTTNQGNMLTAPLMAGARLLGVMLVQASPHHAYGEPERALLRILCAYAAMALERI